MLDFLANNLGTIVVAILLGVIVAAIVVAMVKNKRKGRSSCGGGCGCCPYSGKCHSTNVGEKNDAEK